MHYNFHWHAVGGILNCTKRSSWLRTLAYFSKYPELLRQMESHLDRIADTLQRHWDEHLMHAVVDLLIAIGASHLPLDTTRKRLSGLLASDPEPACSALLERTHEITRFHDAVDTTIAEIATEETIDFLAQRFLDGCLAPERLRVLCFTLLRLNPMGSALLDRLNRRTQGAFADVEIVVPSTPEPDQRRNNALTELEECLTGEPNEALDFFVSRASYLAESISAEARRRLQNTALAQLEEIDLSCIGVTVLDNRIHVTHSDLLERAEQSLHTLRILRLPVPKDIALQYLHLRLSGQLVEYLCGQLHDALSPAERNAIATKLTTPDLPSLVLRHYLDIATMLKIEEALNEVIRIAGSQDYPAPMRQYAIGCLADFAGPQVDSRLTTIMHENDEDIASAACSILLRRGSLDALKWYVPKLTSQLPEGDPEFVGFRDAVIVNVSCHEAVPLFIELLDRGYQIAGTHPNYGAHLRRLALDGLKRVGDRAALDAIYDFMASHDYPHINFLYETIDEIERTALNTATRPVSVPAILPLLAALDQPVSPSMRIVRSAIELKRVVLDAIREHFVHHIEQRGAWQLLYNDDGTPRDEPQVQPLLWFVSAAIEPYGVRMDREVETGRGPVDFKFGCISYACHLELKKSTGKWKNGLRAQIPTYLNADRVQEAIYMVLRLDDTDDETWANLCQEIEAIRDELTTRGYSIELVWIDARRPASASRAH